MVATQDKGGAAEERLLQYFREDGFFALRGPLLRFQDQDVTDIDIWLLGKVASGIREKAGVDVKNKDRPKALERVLWAKGLQSVLRLDRVFVATTDKRVMLRSFADLYGVTLLDGAFLTALPDLSSQRLGHEEFHALLRDADPDKLNGDWLGRVNRCRSSLVSQLTFDGCNAILLDVRFFAEKTSALRSTVACRALYFSIACFLATLDVSLAGLKVLPGDERYRETVHGLRHGRSGKRKVDEMMNLVASYAPELTKRMKHELDASLKAIQAEVIADYFTKAPNAAAMFDLSRQFEAQAFAKPLVILDELDPKLKSIVGVLLDFFQIDRPMVFSSLKAGA